MKSEPMKENNQQRKPQFPIILALTGILMGLVLSVLAVWGDYESTSYGFLRRAQAPFRGLRCPVFIGKNESRVVSIQVSNPTHQTLSPGVRTQISTANEFESKTDYIQLAPGEKKTLQRMVGPENVDLGMFIFVDALVYAAYPMPDQETTCGILVLPITNGTFPLLFGTALSILFMATGTYLLYKNDLSARRSRSLLFIVIATVLAMTAGYLGWWFMALFLIILSVLTLVITAGGFFT